AASVIIGTDKQAALEVYDLSGQRLQRITTDGAPNNVDLRRAVPLAGRTADVVATAGGGFLRFYTLDPITRQLTNASARVIQPDINAGGICLYQSPSSGVTHAFVTAPDGRVEQWELSDSAGNIDARLVRGPWDVGTTVEGCVADDELGLLYVSEQHHAIWKYGAEPTEPTTPLATVDHAAPAGHFTADVEGLALVRFGAGAGYLLASSQGSDSYMVYRRDGDNAFVRSLRVVDGAAADGCSKTDGIEALAANLGPSFPHGVFICQDFKNTAPGSAGNQTFKLVPLEQVVGTDEVPSPPTSSTTVVPVTPPVVDTPASPAPSAAPAVPAPSTSGYWMVGAGGKVFAFGSAPD
ncbi:MAG: phytase, partial [Acidimicrobiia bacterium]